MNRKTITFYWDGNIKSLVGCVQSALLSVKPFQKSVSADIESWQNEDTYLDLGPFYVIEATAYQQALLALDELGKIAEAIDAAANEEDFDGETDETIH
jgi:hypothetical protein